MREPLVHIDDLPEGAWFKTVVTKREGVVLTHGGNGTVVSLAGGGMREEEKSICGRTLVLEMR